MNTLLLEAADFFSSNKARISGHRAQHFIDVVGIQASDTLRCGLIDGELGTAEVTAINNDSKSPNLTLDISLTSKPPEASRLSLLCALPRPKMLRRMLRTCAELGIKDITLINSARVEKSYWQSPNLQPENMRAFCLEGLSQAGDTVLPLITVEKRFKPFVEDRLPAIVANKQHALLAHPRGHAPQMSELAVNAHDQGIVAMGPEGGFTDYEAEKLEAAGFQRFSLGPRILRCDTALPVIIARLS